MLESRRITRNRVARRTALRNTENVQSQLDGLLQSIATTQRQVEDLLQQIDIKSKEVEQLMRGHKLEKHEWGELIAQIVETWSRASKEVDPLTLYNKLKEKDFFSCVKVQLGELGKIMTEKEIEKIATVTPSKKTGDKFEIVRAKKKVSKK